MPEVRRASSDPDEACISRSFLHGLRVETRWRYLHPAVEQEGGSPIERRAAFLFVASTQTSPLSLVTDEHYDCHTTLSFVKVELSSWPESLRRGVRGKESQITS